MKRFLAPGLIFIFVLGFIVRLYRFDGPIADWHSWRQADTSSVSRNLVQSGFNLLTPTYDDISNIASGIDNPNGYRFVEFPIYNAAQAGLFVVFRILTIEEWGRIVSILATLSGAFFVYLLVKKYSNETSGFLSAAFYLFLPYSIYYGRTILPDPSMAATILGGIYFFDKWLEEKSKTNPSKLRASNQKSKFKFKSEKYFILSTVFTACSFLLKPYALFFTLPMVYLVWEKFKFDFFKKWQLWIFAILTLAPLLFWRIRIGEHPEGIPVSAWLFNGNGIRFHPAFFRWIGYERITKLIFGFAGIIFLIDGLLFTIKNKNKGFFISFLLSSLIYVTVIASGNVQHDYYQILILPTLSIFAGLGTYQLYKTLSKTSNSNIAIGACSILVILSFYFSWNIVKDYFNINNPGMVIAGKETDKILPKEAKVIAALPAGQAGDTSFLYYVNRPGWPSYENGLDSLIKMGANYMVIANPTASDIDGLGKMYKIVDQSKDYLILKLNKE